MQPKSKGRGVSRRSDTLKRFSSDFAIWHLYGGSFEHAIDVMQTDKWQQKEQRRKLLKKVPPALRPRVKRMLYEVRRHAELIRESAKEGLIASGFAPAPPSVIEMITFLDVQKGRMGSGTGSLVFNVGLAGEPGNRGWKRMHDIEWAEFMRTEMTYRCETKHVTKSRHWQEAQAPEPYLWNLYGRLTPWHAEVIGDRLERLGEVGALVLENIGKDLAAELEKELGVNVVGIAFHREKCGDLHIHLIFSEFREVPREKDVPVRKFGDMISAEARRRMKAGDKTPFVKLRKQIKAEFENAGKHKGYYFELQVRKWCRPIQTMGPAFSGKMALWEASGRAPDIAEIGDRPIEEANTFRGRIVEPVLRGDDLTKTFIDYWVQRRFQRKIQMLLTEEETTRAANLADAAVERYRWTGSQNLSLDRYVAAEVAKLEENFEEKIREDLNRRAEGLEARETELKKREEKLVLREDAADAGLPAWLSDLLIGLPQRFHKRAKGDAKKLLKSVFAAVFALGRVRAEVKSFSKDFFSGKPISMGGFLLRLGGILGLKEDEIK